MAFQIGGSLLTRGLTTREPINQFAPVRREPVGAVGAATLRWGAPSRFEILEPSQASQPIFIFVPRDDSQDQDNPLDEGLRFLETGRVTRVVRVTNPQDAQDFVDVERIDEITFQGPDGLLRTFVLNNQ